MKRSEMVEIIEDFINENNWVENCKYTSDQFDINNYEAGLLLKRLEEAGILPPFVVDGKEDHQEISSFQYTEKYLCFWEEENGEET